MRALVDCNKGIGSDSMVRITIAPLKRFRGFVVLANVLHDLVAEILYRGKNAPCDQVAFDFREPEFDLVKPGRISRRVMDMHVRVLGQECSDSFRLVSREIVGNDVNLAFSRLMSDDLGDESDKLFAGMARSGSSDNFSGLGVQRRVKRQCAMTVVFKSVPFCSPGR